MTQDDPMEHEFAAAGASCPFVRRPLRIEAHPAAFVIVDAGGTIIAKVEFGPAPGHDGRPRLSAAAARSVARELTRMLAGGDGSSPPDHAQAFAVHGQRGQARRSGGMVERKDLLGPARQEDRHALWKWVTLVAASIAMLRFAVEVAE